MIFSILNLMSVAPMLQILRRDLRKKPCTENDAPAEMHGKWRKMSTSSKKRTKLHSSHLQKFVHYQRRLQQNQRKDHLWKILEHQCTCWETKTGTELNWRLFEHPETPQRLSQPMVKCKQMKKQQCTSTTLIFSLTLHIFEGTLAVLSLGKLCEDHGYSHECASREKTTLYHKWKKHLMQHRKLCSDRCTRIIDRFFQFDCKYISYIVKASNKTTSKYRQSTTGKSARASTQTQNTS